MTSAFYHLFTARQGQLLVPDYALKFLDYGHKLSYEETADVLGECDNCDYEG